MRLLSWLGQSIAGHVTYNSELLDHQAALVSWSRDVTTADFWNRTLPDESATSG